MESRIVGSPEFHLEVLAFGRRGDLLERPSQYGFGRKHNMIDRADPLKERLHLVLARNIDQLRRNSRSESGLCRCQLGRRMARNHHGRTKIENANRDSFTNSGRTTNYKNTFAFHKIDRSATLFPKTQRRL